MTGEPKQDLSLSVLREANVLRLPTFRDRQGRVCHIDVQDDAGNPLPPGYDWPLSRWGNALAGEVGEACNIIKKIERGDYTDEEREGANAQLADELCDILTYVDLLAHRAGIDLSSATYKKWNEVSVRVGSAVRLLPRRIVQG